MPWLSASRFASPEQSPGFVLWRTFMRWQRGLNARLRPFKLTQPQFAILAVCGWLTREGRPVTQQDIVDFLALDRMHVSQIAARLEKDGWIERTTSSTDLRAKRIALTDEGRALLFRVLPLVEEFDAAFFRRESET